MKKLIAVLLAIVMLMGLCACAAKEEQAPAAQESETKTETAAPEKEEAAPEKEEAADPIVVKVGLVSPLTGDMAEKGLNQETAAKLAIDEINENGGILNGKYIFELISEDDAGTPNNSVTVATKLITQDEVNVLVGSLPSTCTLAIMDVTESYGVTQIAPSSTAASITQQGNEYIFRNAASDAVIVAGLIDYAKNTFGYTKFGVISDTTDFGLGGGNCARDLINADPDLELVYDELYTFGDTDFSVQMTKMEAAAPEVVIGWGDSTSFYRLTQQINTSGLDVTFMTGTAAASQAIYDTIGEDAAGVYFGTPFTVANPDPRVQEFAKKFEAVAGYAPDMNAAQNYDAIYMIKEAIEACDSIDSTDIRDAIRSLVDIQGVAGVMNFDETGESNKSISMCQITGGDANSVVYCE